MGEGKRNSMYAFGFMSNVEGVDRTTIWGGWGGGGRTARTLIVSSYSLRELFVSLHFSRVYRYEPLAWLGSIQLVFGTSHREDARRGFGVERVDGVDVTSACGPSPAELLSHPQNARYTRTAVSINISIINNLLYHAEHNLIPTTLTRTTTTYDNVRQRA